MARNFFNYCIYGVLFLSLFAAALAQEDNDSTFKVTSFVPERFSDLELKVEGGVDLRTDYQHDWTDEGADPSADLHYESDTYNLGLSPLFSYLYWTRQFQINYTVKGSLKMRFDHYTDSAAKSINDYEHNISLDGDTYDISLNQSLEYTQYLSGNLYVEFTGSLDTRYANGDNQKDTYSFYRTSYTNTTLDRITEITTNASYRKKIYEFDFHFIPALGRKYDGRFAVTAIYIINEFRKRGLLSRELTYSEMTGLAQLIYQYRKRHIIDSRIRRIESNVAVIEYLQGQGVISDIDYLGVLHLQDIWDYYPDEQREFGNTVGIGIGIEISFNRERSNANTRTTRIYEFLTNPNEIDSTKTYQSDSFERKYWKNTDNDLYILFKYGSETPLNFKWQRSIGFEYTYHFPSKIKDIQWISDTHSSIGGTSEIELKDMFSGNFDVEYRYFMSSRSDLMINISTPFKWYRYYEYTYIDNVRTLFEYSKNGFFDILAKFQFNYRIAIPSTLGIAVSNHMRLAGSSRINYGYSDNYFQRITKVNLTFTHYIL